MEKMDLVTELEGLKKNVRGLEKENRRMSSSMISLGLNECGGEEGTTLSRRTSASSSSFLSASGPNQSPEDLDITPRPSAEVKTNNVHKRRTSDSDVLNKPRRGSATSFMSMSRLYSTSSTSSISSIQSNTNTAHSTFISTPDASEFEDDFNEQNKNGIPSESALTDELIQVKMEKFSLMQENDDLNKTIAELENSLKNSQLANEALQEKNVFLRGEIERLDEEATQAVYEQCVMGEQIKEVKDLKLQNGKLVKENEKVKKEVEVLKAKVVNGDDVFYDNSSVVRDDNSSRRSSFMNFFTGNTSDGASSPIRRGSETAKSMSNFVMDVEDLLSINGENEYELSDDINEFDIIPQCNGECISAKRVEELEQMLADVKLRLAESEESRETMSSQLEGLRMLINGYSNGEAGRPMSPGNGISKSKQEKRMSLASFFSGS